MPLPASAAMLGGSSLPSLTQNTSSRAEATTSGGFGTGSFQVNNGGTPPWVYLAFGGMALIGLVIFMRGRK